VLPYSRQQPRAFLQAALQDFAWTRAQLRAALARRASVAGGGASAALAREPMFCMETALEALWWSMLAYEDAAEALPGVPDKDATLPRIMALCGVDSIVAFHEHRTALHVVAAWGTRRVIVAFRGTAEPANFKADLQLCLTAPAVKLHAGSDADAAVSAPGTRWGDRPAVHRGFMHTWTHARVNKRCGARAMPAACACQLRAWLRATLSTALRAARRIVSFLVARVHDEIARSGKPPHVLLCGHSLGGALATLAAMDLREACGDALPPSHLTAVTFGCPRVGSAALARYYDARVCPEHWAVINQHDLITHGGRLFGVCVRVLACTHTCAPAF
jgi:hypothetical protein